MARGERKPLALGDRQATTDRDDTLDKDPDVCLADIEPESVSWLWTGRIAYGKLTLIEGDPGLGKSALCIKVAASESTGSPLPVDIGPHPPGDVLLISYEDGDADTIRPRAEAAGAALERVRIWKLGRRPFTIPDDLPALRLLIKERDYRLVIIDPLGAALSGATDSYKDADIRRTLAPLAAIAEETGAAIVIVRHLTKRGTGRAISPGGGSIGIAGAARSVLVVGEDPEDPDRRILASVKCNLTLRPPSLAFRLASVFVPRASYHPVVTFDGEASISADDLATARAEASNDGGAEGRSAVQDASDFLREWLAPGPLSRREVEGLAKSNGVSIRTLQRACRAAGVTVDREGSGKTHRSVWRLESTRANTSSAMEREPKLGPTLETHATRARAAHVRGDWRDWREC
jgi:hypothetical protein